jgi:PIN domain nuclease of toxin-antitoxin system
MTDRATGLVLLDTHIWIWLLEGEGRRLAPHVTAAIERAADAWHVRVSAMSVWEVALLTARRRITLSLDCESWVIEALNKPGVQLEPLAPAIAVASTRLPDFPHRDPVDRILVATARVTGATLVTRDRRILDYAARGYLRVLDATPNV